MTARVVAILTCLVVMLAACAATSAPRGADVREPGPTTTEPVPCPATGIGPVGCVRQSAEPVPCPLTGIGPAGCVHTEATPGPTDAASAPTDSPGATDDDIVQPPEPDPGDAESVETREPEDPDDAAPVIEPAPAFACDADPQLAKLDILESGWHNKLVWGTVGCVGPARFDTDYRAVRCTTDQGFLIYHVSDPPLLEPNVAPSDPSLHARVWMTNVLWFVDASSRVTGYQSPWLWADMFVRENLATGDLSWDTTGQWFDGNGQMVRDGASDTVSLDTRTILSSPARAAVVDYLVYWPGSESNGRGATSGRVDLSQIGFC